MTRVALALAAALAFTAPVAADTLGALLPTFTFPDDTVTSSTKGCATPTTQAACQLAE